MLPTLPLFVSLVFVFATLITFAFLYIAFRRSSQYASKANVIAIGLGAWLIFQMVLGLSGFYSSHTQGIPPRFVLQILLPLLLILGLFLTPKGKQFIDGLPLVPLTYLNIVRIPVELVLYWLFLNQAVPELMTFAGRNFDILAGITAPFIAYFGLQRNILGQKAVLAWNYLSLGLLLFIIGNAALSAPTFMQKFAFDQPNIGIFYFPFVWLPSFVVPAALFTHVVSIRRLIKKG